MEPYDPAVAARILIVEDDDAIRGHLLRVLPAAGYDVEGVPCGEDALDRFRAALAEGSRFGVVILDLGLPDRDGLEVCRDLVALDPTARVVMLTARAEEIDVVIGLDSGAVDYVTKPFRLAELLARVRAQLREPAQERTIEHGGIRVDLDARRVWRRGVELELRAQEFDLLAVLLAHAGRAVSREQLMRDAWDEHWFGSTKTLDVHIAALRRKLDTDDHVSVITTIRRFGYRFEAE
jgi:DNA-binding response OmpR family regulator